MTNPDLSTLRALLAQAKDEIDRLMVEKDAWQAAPASSNESLAYTLLISVQLPIYEAANTARETEKWFLRNDPDQPAREASLRARVQAENAVYWQQRTEEQAP